MSFPLIQFPGFRNFEALAARRFTRALPLMLRLYGLDVDVLRRSSREVRSEGVTVEGNDAASRMYEVGGGLGLGDPVGAEVRDLSTGGVEEVVGGGEVSFRARVLPPSHVYQASDPLYLSEFENHYMFTLDGILPGDGMRISRMDGVVKSYRAMEVDVAGNTSGELGGVGVETAKGVEWAVGVPRRVLVSPLQDVL